MNRRTVVARLSAVFAGVAATTAAMLAAPAPAKGDIISSPSVLEVVWGPTRTAAWVLAGVLAVVAVSAVLAIVALRRIARASRAQAEAARSSSTVNAITEADLDEEH